MSEHTAPVPSLEHAEQIEREVLPASYVFVDCYHTPDNAKAIVEAIADCDTVVIESLGLRNEEERRVFTNKLNELANATTAPSGVVVTDDKQILSPFHQALMDAGLTGSGKRIELMDIMQDDPDYPVAGAALEAALAYGSGIGSPYVSVDELRSLLASSAVKWEQGNVVRDPKMAARLMQLGRTPGKIGVVKGLMHDGVTDILLSKAVAETEQVVVRTQNREQFKVEETTDFTQYEQLYRKMRRDKTGTPDPGLIDRMLVEDLANYSLDTNHEHGIHDQLKLLTQKDVTDLLDRIDDLRTSASCGSKPGMRQKLKLDTKYAIMFTLRIPERRAEAAAYAGASTLDGAMDTKPGRSPNQEAQVMEAIQVMSSYLLSYVIASTNRAIDELPEQHTE